MNQVKVSILLVDDQHKNDEDDNISDYSDDFRDKNPKFVLTALFTNTKSSRKH